MKRILLAISNDFITATYSEVFEKEGFSVLKTKKGKEAKDLAIKEKPDIIIADIMLSEIGGLELLKGLNQEDSTKKIPVIIFAQFEKKEDREKAMELEAKDFITAAGNTPSEVIRRVKIALGEQKSYSLFIEEDTKDAKELIKELGYDKDLKCSECDSRLVLDLIRDLSRGKNYFIASFICPKCLLNNKK